MGPASTYRHDVDGLRALAVLGVLIYHLNANWLPGGFVGVDVFFVISGYLITGIIVRELDNGRFKYGKFLLRRARRLVPAYAVMLLATTAISFAVLSPQDAKAFAFSLFGAVTGTSNFVFWMESGYFDNEAITKPLLHTWSLSVEWQYYLIFPACAWLAMNFGSRRTLVWLILTAGVISLLANLLGADGIDFMARFHIAFGNGNSSLFFLIPFRVFEFVIGAMLVWAPEPRSRQTLVINGVAALGIASIASSAFSFRDLPIYPSYYALLPAIGTAIILWTGRVSAIGKALEWRHLVWVGQRSYSLYLVHWPLISLYLYAVDRSSLLLPEAITIGGLSLAFAALLYSFIETPFRHPTWPWKLSQPLTLVIIAATTGAVGLTGITSQGWPWRLPDRSQAIYRAYLHDAEIGALEGARGCRRNCQFGNMNSSEVILVVGDSHANHYTRALDMEDGRFRYRVIQSASCFMGATLSNARLTDYHRLPCEKQISDLERYIEDDNVVGVIHAQRWISYHTMTDANGDIISFDSTEDQFATEVQDVLARYEGTGLPVLLVGFAPNTNTWCLMRPLSIGQCASASLEANETLQKVAEREIDKSQLRAAFIDPTDIMCPNHDCELISSEGGLVYADNHHYTIGGARMVTPALTTEITSLLGPTSQASAR